MAHPEKEKRKHTRFKAKLIVSYRIFKDKDAIEVSQTKNIGLGGMLLTTNRLFEPGTCLALEIRLPFDQDPINIIAKVEDSQEIEKDNIFDTRLSFLSIDEKHKNALLETLEYYSKKESKENQ